MLSGCVAHASRYCMETSGWPVMMSLGPCLEAYLRRIAAECLLILLGVKARVYQGPKCNRVKGLLQS